jgi:hypothetical protein
MANTNTVTDYEDPFQLADLAKREGPEGLLRLAEYFETTGQQTPLTVKTALAMSRGPGVFPINGASTSDPTPRVPRTIPGEMEYFEAHPNAEMRANGQVYDSRTGALLAKSMREAVAQGDAPPPYFLRQSTVPDYGSPAGSAAGSFASSVSAARPAKKDEYDLTEQEIQAEAEGFSITPEQMRTWLSQERNRKQQGARPASPAARPTPARRAAASSVAQGPVPSYTLEDVVQGQTPEAIAKSARNNVSLTPPIPFANASTRTDAPAAIASTLPSAGPQTPAGKPDSSDKDGMVAPSSEGAGGDTSERDLYLARLAAQNAAGFGGMGAGKNIDMGIADTLGERLKQVQALRAKKLERQEGLDVERSQNNQTLDMYKSLFPDKANSLEALRDLTGKGAVFKQGLDAWMKREELEKAKIPTAEARIGQMGAGEDLTRAKIPEVPLEGQSKRLAREQAAALGWARFNAQSAEAAARALDRAATTTTNNNAIRSELEKIQKITQKGGYVPLAAALEQADKAIADLGRPPSIEAQAKHALPGGDRFLNPEEKAYFNSIDKLKQMEQLAISGKVVSESERKEFVRQYGTSWYANPTAAAAYIDLFRQKTASQIRMDLATIRATPVGKEALRLYEAENGLTENAAVLKGNGTAARPVKPSAVIAGKTVLWNVAEGKWKAIPNDNVDAAVTSGKYER